ncbi:hypothetical protein NQ314_018974 [Rhamnusium bicolor]|uniref:Uncharacterized protein n=1 Tax=Rhamnusium bicolor TaxID=1586634 RepID=A0AAV8WPN1_9CUCU|nr:hypothetical protein NQ314_018974 [Rhamnusium bicolor]
MNALGSRPTSKRTSKKSKESFINLDEKKKKDDASSVQSLSGKRRKSPTSASGSQVNKKRSNSLGVTKRSSVSKRKSITSTSVTDKKDSRSFLNEITLMPEIIPEYTEAWNVYVNDNDSTYKTILEYYKTNENDMQFIYATYLTEMKKLQYYKEIVEKRKNEILEAQMIRVFNETDQSEFFNEDLVPGSNAKLCQDNLNSAKIDLTEQQEVVLKWQSELKICLNNRREIKSLLTENFDDYCKEKFKLPIPSLCEEETLIQEIDPDIKVNKRGEDNGEQKESTQTSNEKIIKLNNLRKTMERELRKDMKLKAIKNTTWRNFPLLNS